MAVLADQEGAHTHFRWREKDYQVSSRPAKWFARTEWWVGERAHRVIGSGAVEVEKWRFKATGYGSECPVELLPNTSGNSRTRLGEINHAVNAQSD